MFSSEGFGLLEVATDGKGAPPFSRVVSQSERSFTRPRAWLAQPSTLHLASQRFGTALVLLTRSARHARSGWERLGEGVVVKGKSPFLSACIDPQ